MTQVIIACDLKFILVLEITIIIPTKKERLIQLQIIDRSLFHLNLTTNLKNVVL